MSSLQMGHGVPKSFLSAANVFTSRQSCSGKRRNGIVWKPNNPLKDICKQNTTRFISYNSMHRMHCIHCNTSFSGIFLAISSAISAVTIQRILGKFHRNTHAPITNLHSKRAQNIQGEFHRRTSILKISKANFIATFYPKHSLQMQRPVLPLSHES